MGFRMIIIVSLMAITEEIQEVDARIAKRNLSQHIKEPKFFFDVIENPDEYFEFPGMTTEEGTETSTLQITGMSPSSVEETTIEGSTEESNGDYSDYDQLEMAPSHGSGTKRLHTSSRHRKNAEFQGSQDSSGFNDPNAVNNIEQNHSSDDFLNKIERQLAMKLLLAANRKFDEDQRKKREETHSRLLYLAKKWQLSDNYATKAVDEEMYDEFVDALQMMRQPEGH